MGGFREEGGSRDRTNAGILLAQAMTGKTRSAAQFTADWAVTTLGQVLHWQPHDPARALARSHRTHG